MNNKYFLLGVYYALLTIKITENDKQKSEYFALKILETVEDILK